jgi:hypothetical protein
MCMAKVVSVLFGLFLILKYLTAGSCVLVESVDFYHQYLYQVIKHLKLMRKQSACYFSCFLLSEPT